MHPKDRSRTGACRRRGRPGEGRDVHRAGSRKTGCAVADEPGGGRRELGFHDLAPNDAVTGGRRCMHDVRRARRAGRRSRAAATSSSSRSASAAAGASLREPDAGSPRRLSRAPRWRTLRTCPTSSAALPQAGGGLAHVERARRSRQPWRCAQISGHSTPELLAQRPVTLGGHTLELGTLLLNRSRDDDLVARSCCRHSSSVYSLENGEGSACAAGSGTLYDRPTPSVGSRSAFRERTAPTTNTTVAR